MNTKLFLQICFHLYSAVELLLLYDDADFEDELPAPLPATPATV